MILIDISKYDLVFLVSDDILATMKDDDSPAILQADPDEERMLLQKRADEMMSGKSVVDAMQSQNEKLGHLLTEDETIDNIIGSMPILEDSNINTNINTNTNTNTNVRMIEPVTNSVKPEPINNHISEKTVVVDDPILTMFKGVKRSVNFETKISINELIPRLDFIEMMEDSYNKSIVEYLADEFTNKLLSDPDKIKQMIIDDITAMYKKDNGEVKEEVIIDKKIKDEPIKTDQLNDSNEPPKSKRGKGARNNNVE